MRKGLYIVLGIVATAIIIALIFASKQTKATINRYESIPEKPADFDAFMREIWRGTYVELCDLDERYWQRPEFYGNAWLNAKEKFYDNPDYELWGVYGYGGIPYKISYTFTNLKKGDVFETCNFFHAGFGVWTYQGFKLVPFGENEYFDVEIEPNQFYLSPTFPVFEKGWTKRIKLKIIVKETPPAGKYVVGYDVDHPDPEFSRKTLKEILFMQVNKEIYMKDCLTYLGNYERCEKLINLRQKKYVDGTEYRTDIPPFTVEIIVQ